MLIKAGENLIALAPSKDSLTTSNLCAQLEECGGFWNFFPPTGVMVGARNGFLNGLEEEEGHTDADIYPVDGPLQSGMQSLRRIKTNTNTKLSKVSIQ